jgi:hypothetical protein
MTLPSGCEAAGNLDALFVVSGVGAFFGFMVEGESLKAASDIMGAGTGLVKTQVKEWKN